MAKGARAKIALLVNVISSVGIVFVNKQVFRQFPYGTALTVIHFITGFFFAYILTRLIGGKPDAVPLKSILSICVAFCGYVGFNNLSLLYNDVTVYQVAKIICTPVIIFIQTRWMNKPLPSKGKLLGLVPTLTGCFITFYGGGNLNFLGTMFAVLAIFANSAYTILGQVVQEKENGIKLTPMQVLLYQTPISAVMLSTTIPMFDDYHALLAAPPSMEATGWILLSCVFAFGVNVSFFFFVGLTSPLDMNVAGYLKTCLVLVGGVLWGERMSQQATLGILITMVGLLCYNFSQYIPDRRKSVPEREHLV